MFVLEEKRPVQSSSFFYFHEFQGLYKMKVLYYQFSNNSSHFILIIKSPSLLLIHCSSFFVLVNRKTCGSKPFLPCFREGISQKGLFLMLLLQLIRSDLFNHSPHLKYTYVCFKYNAFIETTDIISFLKLLNQKQPKDTLMNMDFYMQIAKNVGLKESQNGSNFLFSPVSIHAVLSMVAAGSSGQTSKQILSFLKSESTHALKSVVSQLIHVISADETQNGGPRLSFVNGV